MYGGDRQSAGSAASGNPAGSVSGVNRHTEMCQQLHKLGCYQDNLITHSVMLGQRDNRLPKSGKLQCSNHDEEEMLYE